MERIFKSPIGAPLLMVCGLICFACGGCCLSREEEKEITPFNLAEFERTGKKPSKQWLEIADVYVLWDQKKELMTWMKDRWGNKIGNATVNSIYLPIVSKEAFENGGNAPPVGRAFVTFRPGETERQLTPGAGPVKLTGMAFGTLDDTFLSEMGLKVDQVIILHNNVTPAPRSTLINIAIFSFVLGFLLVAPFCGQVIAKLKRSRRKPKRRRRNKGRADVWGDEDRPRRRMDDDDD